MFNIVLVEPEIPSNTGNVSRTCAVTGSALHLVEPLGFSVDDKHLKRAGLDYWDKLEVHYYRCFADVQRRASQEGAAMYLFTTHADANYADASYKKGDYLVFGKETAGLGPDILQSYPQNHVRIPMRPTLRSLNLSNSVAIAVYEALRRVGFEGML